MFIILYNPLSRNGKSVLDVKELEKKFLEKSYEVKVHSLLDINNVDAFINSLDEKDKIIIVGGDGTVHRIANSIYDKKIVNNIYLYKSGTGNDFLRSLKSKNRLVIVTPYLKKLPIVEFNGNNKRFLNGVGIGLDGLVCYKVNHSSKTKNKWNYFRNTILAFMQSKKIKKVNVTIDEKPLIFKNVWLVSTMNGEYLGAGMKLAPKANRNKKELYTVIIKGIPKWLLVFALPLVYLGWQKILGGFVRTFLVKDKVEININEENYLQADGEVEYPVTKVLITTCKEE